MTKPHHVLFLCTGNSARSIMAEAILNQRGQPDFVGYSAGSHPSGMVRPEAVRQLKAAGFTTDGLRSKSWDEFSRKGSSKIDLVVTVCDSAATEICPIWPGHPMTAHWGVPDPAVIQGSAQEVEQAFHDAFQTLLRRIDLFRKLPFLKLNEASLKYEIDKIGQS